MKSVLKWVLEINDDLQKIGSGPVVHVGGQNGNLCVWTEEPAGTPRQDRTVVVHGTGHRVYDVEVHLGSAVMPPFVWHVYEVSHD